MSTVTASTMTKINSAEGAEEDTRPLTDPATTPTIRTTPIIAATAVRNCCVELLCMALTRILFRIVAILVIGLIFAIVYGIRDGIAGPKPQNETLTFGNDNYKLLKYSLAVARAQQHKEKPWWIPQH